MAAALIAIGIVVVIVGAAAIVPNLVAMLVAIASSNAGDRRASRLAALAGVAAVALGAGLIAWGATL